MSVLRFIGIPFEEWRLGEQLDDKIQEAGIQLYQAGIQRPTVGQIQEVLDAQGVDVHLRQSENPDEDTIIVQRRATSGVYTDHRDYASNLASLC